MPIQVWFQNFSFLLSINSDEKKLENLVINSDEKKLDNLVRLLNNSRTFEII